MQSEAPVFGKVSMTARDAGGAECSGSTARKTAAVSLACHLLCMYAACKGGSFSLIFSHL